MSNQFDPSGMPVAANAANVVSPSVSTNVGSSLIMGIVGGLVAAIVGAAIWAAIIAITKIETGIAAIGVGALVGISVRFFGRGQTPVYGIIGGVLALIAVILGNLLAVAILVSNEPGVHKSFVDTLSLMISYPKETIQAFQDFTKPLDVLFYLIAIYEGYRFATGRIGRRRR